MDSREGLLSRENEIIRILHIFIDEGLDFIVVDGYAIATFKKRFSVDLDLIIKEKNLPEFKNMISKEGYSLDYDKDIELVYGEKFKRFSKKINSLKVSIDFLINGLVSRTTDSTWSFDYIKKHSYVGKLNSLKFLIPEKELLISMKFHSGRLQDIRDIVALMPSNNEKVMLHIFKGDTVRLRENIKRLKIFLYKPQFDDSFKGIFGISAFNENDVK